MLFSDECLAKGKIVKHNRVDVTTVNVVIFHRSTVINYCRLLCKNNQSLLPYS